MNTTLQWRKQRAVCVFHVVRLTPKTPQQWYEWMRVHSHADTRPLSPFQQWSGNATNRDRRRAEKLYITRPSECQLCVRHLHNKRAMTQHWRTPSHTYIHTLARCVLEEISWKWAPTGTDSRTKLRLAFISGMCILLYMIKYITACQMWWFESILGLFLTDHLMPVRWQCWINEPYLNMLWRHPNKGYIFYRGLGSKLYNNNSMIKKHPLMSQRLLYYVRVNPILVRFACCRVL